MKYTQENTPRFLFEFTPQEMVYFQNLTGAHSCGDTGSSFYEAIYKIMEEYPELFEGCNMDDGTDF